MNIEDVRDFSLTFPGVEESFPFDTDTLAFKTNGKIFVLMSLQERRINVKCNPELAEELRLRYEDVIPGVHMSKKHWNTLNLNGILTDDFIKEQICNSYKLVAKLKK